MRILLERLCGFYPIGAVVLIDCGASSSTTQQSLAQRASRAVSSEVANYGAWTQWALDRIGVGFAVNPPAPTSRRVASTGTGRVYWVRKERFL